VDQYFLQELISPPWLQAAFTYNDPKIAKRQSSHQCIFCAFWICACKSFSKNIGEINRRCQFHQHYMHAFFIQISLRQLFSSYMYAGYCWIGLLDCSIRIAIQFGGLDCNWQSKVKIGFWIWIVNPVFPFQSKSNTSNYFIMILKFHSGIQKNWIEQ